MEFIISGYGAEPDNTIALYSIEDTTVHRLWEDSVENPSFVCGGDGYLFTVTENDNYAVVYMYQSCAGGFKLLDSKRISGGALCHITYSSVNKALFGACYITGTVFSVRVNQDKFGELLYQEVQRGTDSSVLTRAHCVLLNREETELITVNIALDRISYYEIKEGSLTLRQFIKVPEGIGPRHAILSEDESLLYIITEYSNEILVYRNGQEKKLVQRISTLPEGFSGVSNCSALCFSRDRRFLYAANRGAQTIALFSVNTEGTLTYTGDYDCKGKHPRHMIVTKDGSYLIVCNQNSDNAAVFSLDRDNGALKEQIVSISFSSPSGVLEL